MIATRLASVCLLCFSMMSHAQDQPAQESQPPAGVDPLQAEFDAAAAEAKAKSSVGPTDVVLADQAVLKLPQGYVYFPGKESGRLLRAMGNRVTQDPLGMVVAGEGKEGHWFVVMYYEPAGYIKDDDAKEWNAEELLQNIREGTDAANEERRGKGIPESRIIGWIEAPAYDASRHRLVWSIASKIKDEPDNAETTVNYNTYALGREGYISMNLVTGATTIENEKAFAKELLSALNFNSGKKYEEFDSSTDKVAEYGLAALIGGVAAKKLGLFAVIAAFAVKFAKVIGIAAIAIGALLVKYFRGRESASSKSDGDPRA